MGPDSCSRLFVSTSSLTLNYSRWYRTIHKLVDKPDVVLPASLNASSPHFVPNPLGGTISYAGRFPAHASRTSRPVPRSLATWGRNTRAPRSTTSCRWILRLPAGMFPPPATRWFSPPSGASSTSRVAPSPGTTGSTSSSSRSRGSSSTPLTPGRSASRTATWSGFAPRVPSSVTWSNFPRAVYGSGFRARVGTGLATGQKVGTGVVAIPWHWGEQGLSTGSRANDLCIDAGDANSMIPESKACLCSIEKM